MQKRRDSLLCNSVWGMFFWNSWKRDYQTELFAPSEEKGHYPALRKPRFPLIWYSLLLLEWRNDIDLDKKISMNEFTHCKLYDSEQNDYALSYSYSYFDSPEFDLVQHPASPLPSPVLSPLPLLPPQKKRGWRRGMNWDRQRISNP